MEGSVSWLGYCSRCKEDRHTLFLGKNELANSEWIVFVSTNSLFCAIRSEFKSYFPIIVIA